MGVVLGGGFGEDPWGITWGLPLMGIPRGGQVPLCGPLDGSLGVPFKGALKGALRSALAGALWVSLVIVNPGIGDRMGIQSCFKARKYPFWRGYYGPN